MGSRVTGAGAGIGTGAVTAAGVGGGGGDYVRGGESLWTNGICGIPHPGTVGGCELTRLLGSHGVAGLLEPLTEERLHVDGKR